MADESAILECNQLRKSYRPDLLPFKIQEEANQCYKIYDNCRFNFKDVSVTHGNSELNYISDSCWNIRGLPKDGTFGYANACIQSLLHSSTIRRSLIYNNNSELLKVVFKQYISKTTVNMKELRTSMNLIYKSPEQQDVAEFLLHLCHAYTSLRDVIRHELITTT